MISPGTDVFGSSLPSTAHSISRAFGTPASTTTLRSNCERQLDRRHQLVAVLTFEMPTLEPRLAGFTNTGRPSARDLLQHRVAIAIPLGAHEAVPGARPAGRAPRTASSSPPCPCRPPTPARRGRRTASWRARADPAPCRPRRTGHAAPGRPRRALERTSQHRRLAALDRSCARRYGASLAPARAALRRAPVESPPRPTSPSAARSGSVQRPSFSMRIGIGSYLSRSMCLKIDAAEVTDTSCSPDRPPKMIPTRNFFTQR